MGRRPGPVADETGPLRMGRLEDPDHLHIDAAAFRVDREGSPAGGDGLVRLSLAEEDGTVSAPHSRGRLFWRRLPLVNPR